MTRIGYIRLSREDGKSLSIENQKSALRAFDASMKIFVDEGVSGENNLTDSKSAWTTKVRPLFQQDPKSSQIVVYTFDRLGRKKGKVLSEVEDITDSGGSVYVVRESKTYDDSEDFSQAIDLTFRSLSDEAYRVEGKKKTQRAIDSLKLAEVPLGRKPSLTDKDVLEIKRLSALGLGLTSIGKAVRTLRKKDGLMTVTAPRTIKKVLSGEYESREAYDLRDYKARRKMLAKGVLKEEENA